jgi:hypothetical protein
VEECALPVTVKLSRQTYEKLGDEVVNELVGILNAVDSASRDQLRELNEANAQRIDAKFASFEARMNAFEARVDARFDAFRVEMHAFKAELIKWMFLFWIGTVASLGGLMLALAGR